MFPEEFCDRFSVLRSGLLPYEGAYLAKVLHTTTEFKSPHEAGAHCVCGRPSSRRRC